VHNWLAPDNVNYEHVCHKEPETRAFWITHIWLCHPHGSCFTCNVGQKNQAHCCRNGHKLLPHRTIIILNTLNCIKTMSYCLTIGSGILESKMAAMLFCVILNISKWSWDWCCPTEYCLCKHQIVHMCSVCIIFDLWNFCGVVSFDTKICRLVELGWRHFSRQLVHSWSSGLNVHEPPLIWY